MASSSQHLGELQTKLRVVVDQLAGRFSPLRELIAEALNQANLATEKSREETERGLEALRQERAGSQRALDRYLPLSRKEAGVPLNVERGSGRYTETGFACRRGGISQRTSP